ncbi:MAG: hypothetical protein JWL72_2160 [Ilumatobacteraceae bacterium]|nr:hypothetical protein [Ilumatobacteraceae bacterium]
MTTQLVALGWDANDPGRLARFWAEALRWDVGAEVEGVISLVPTDGTQFQIDFARVPQPKGASANRLHLDLTTTSRDDQTQTVEHLIELGGRHLDIGQRPEEDHIVLADPEGNELCIIGPTNAFLSTCGRFGSITCVGTRAVGYFWSAALGWPFVWDQDDETAIRAPDLTGPMITWGGGPQTPKSEKNRLHLDIAPAADGDQLAEVERLIALGARRIDIGQGDVDWIVMADPDDNEFCVLTPR